MASSMIIAVSWSAASACSRRAREPSDTQQYGTGGGPSSASASAMKATLHGVSDGRDDAPDVVGARVLAHEGLDDGGQALGDGSDAGDVLLLDDVADEEDRVGLLEPHEVGRGDDTGGLTIADHGQVVDIAREHLHEHLEREGLGGRGDGILGHDALDRVPGIHPDGQSPAAQVAVGDDADDIVVLDDEQGGDLRIGHDRRCLADRRGRRGGDGRAGRRSNSPAS
jgi:hypothetical protein